MHLEVAKAFAQPMARSSRGPAFIDRCVRRSTFCGIAAPTAARAFVLVAFFALVSLPPLALARRVSSDQPDDASGGLAEMGPPSAEDIDDRDDERGAQMWRLMRLLSSQATDQERIACARQVVATALQEVERSGHGGHKSCDLILRVLASSADDERSSSMLRCNLREQAGLMLRAMERTQSSSAINGEVRDTDTLSSSEDEWFDASADPADFDNSDESCDMGKLMSGETRDLRTPCGGAKGQGDVVGGGSWVPPTAARDLLRELVCWLL